MSQFSYSLCLSLMHSLWQSAFALCIYSLSLILFKNQLPLVKRNLLLFLLVLQIVISGYTFFYYYTGEIKGLVELQLNRLIGDHYFTENLYNLILAGYMFIVFYKTVKMVYNWKVCKQMCSMGLIKPSADLKIFTFLKSNELGISKKVTLWLSDNISSPLTIGFIKPVILLPVALVNRLTIAETESLIIHELTHIRNNDFGLNWLIIITENIFFFNPFIKIIANKIKLEREKNCDVQVLQFKYPMINYAETLLKAAKFKRNTNIFQLAAVFKTSDLIHRIKYISSGNNLEFHKKYLSLSFIPIISATLIINIFLIPDIRNNKKANNNISSAQNIEKVFPNLKAISYAASTGTHGVNLPEAGNKNPTKFQKKLIPKKSTQSKSALSTGFVYDINSEIYAIPAAQTYTDDTKQVILQEESSGTGECLTKAYSMKWKKGKWQAELLWIINETKPYKDSIQPIDQINRSFPVIQ